MVLMDKSEAVALADARLSELQREPYQKLVDRLLRKPHCEDVVALSGRRHQLEIEAHWDDRKKRTLRVYVAVDDGGLRALMPLTRSFIIAPNGSFIGE
jgi:hypothetical protein